MRTVLNYRRNGNSAIAGKVIRLGLLMIGVGFVSSITSSEARAQLIQAAMQPGGQSAISNGVITAAANSASRGTSAVDASYSLLDDKTSVQPASHLGGHFGNQACPADACFAGCDVNYYIFYDALWLRRENDERFSLSRNTFLNDFEFEFGGRYTIGTMLDCTNAWEAVYAGPFDWNRFGQATSTTGALQSLLQPLNGYTAADIDTFNNADVHTQDWRAQLHSFELNRRWWAWDVLSTAIGIRYVDYEEDFAFQSASAQGNGIFLESVDNQLIGVQLGGDLLYPVNLRTNVGFKLKGGVYANFADRRTVLNNNGTLLLNAGDSDVTVAGVIEGGIYTQYAITRSIRLTAGYEFWYLPGMATVPEQMPSIITPASGTTVFDEDDLFLHGASFGAQILF